mmetsp:Transcript_47873/g.116583  ORF Transcript_47873/g.116583 Transcript_47873/m.116583 type:complete len:256 (+) Transcript_47873:237-1004(+)
MHFSKTGESRMGARTGPTTGSFLIRFTSEGRKLPNRLRIPKNSTRTPSRAHPRSTRYSPKRKIEDPRARCLWNMKSLLFFQPTASTTPATTKMFPVPISVLFRKSMKPRKDRMIPTAISANPIFLGWEIRPELSNCLAVSGFSAAAVAITSAPPRRRIPAPGAPAQARAPAWRPPDSPPGLMGAGCLAGDPGRWRERAEGRAEHNAAPRTTASRMRVPRDRAAAIARTRSELLLVRQASGRDRPRQRHRALAARS